MAFTVPTNIREFLEKRGLVGDKYDAMMKAFTVYCKAAYSDTFNRVEDSKTIDLTISRMDETRLAALYAMFTRDWAQTLPEIKGEHTYGTKTDSNQGQFFR